MPPSLRIKNTETEFMWSVCQGTLGFKFGTSSKEQFDYKDNDDEPEEKKEKDKKDDENINSKFRKLFISNI
jgi:hypothetical protein